MKIVPIKIDTKTLYVNRHLYTDDTQYNSLIISNLVNKNVNLLDVQSFYTLDNEYKIQIYKDTHRVFFTEIFTKRGICHIFYDGDTIVKKWETMEYIPEYLMRMADILTIVY